MKKRIIALLICAHMILSAAAPIAASAKGLTDKTLTPDIPLSDAVTGDETDTDDEITEPSDEENGSETGDPESSDEENNSGSEGDGSVDGTDDPENPNVTPEDGNSAEGTPPPVDENNDGGANFGGEGNEPVVGENGTEVVEPEPSDTEVVLDEGDDELTEDERTQALQAAWAILNSETSYVPTPMSYNNFIKQEAKTAWANPALYVGHTAIFNMNNWINFRYATDILETAVDDGESYIEADSLLDENGDSIQVVITDYYFDDTVEDYHVLWYKIEAANGYELPEVLEDNPYILYYDDADPQTLIMLPKQGMFANDKVFIKKQKVEASAYKELEASLLPEFFNVAWRIHYENDTVWSGYDLGDVTSWSELITSADYRYVDESSVILFPAEVCKAYEDLLNAKSAKEFEDILLKIPHSVLEQFTAAHKTNATKHLTALENVKYETTVFINGTEVPVSVSGRIPTQGLELNVGVVEDKDVMGEGFALDDVTDIIAALDIKLLNPDKSEWQPEEGKLIAVSIGIGALGYEDGSIVQLQHKHGEHIEMFEIFIVLDGAVTVYTGGLSIYLVNRVGSESTANRVATNNATFELEVGDSGIYYIRRNNNTTPKGAWTVTDTTGAIYYTVHNNTTIESSPDGVSVPWIRIVALKEATNVTLRYNWNGDSETFTLNIVGPEADPGEKKLYLKDEVNTSGSIVATLVDDDGDVISGGLDGAKFSWTRSDGMFIVPQAYGNNYSSVNIARDHGGMVESRKTGNKHDTIKYTVTATLSDGTELTADYTVYYQSEFLNSNFENPAARNSSYSFFANGWEELFWKTTAPGTGGNVTKDIEYGDVTGVGTNATQYGVHYAADWRDGGVQFAELNAEEFGALYQDIITAPGEDIEWGFSHAPRPDQGTTDVQNAMFIIVGPTKYAQELTTQNDLNGLVGLIPDNNSTWPCKVQDPQTGAEYQIWYHDAGSPGNGVHHGQEPYDDENGRDRGWTKLAGTYSVPDGQYRTRLFFVSDASKSQENSKNYGNLIDSARVGQYKKYLIEYYEETFVQDGNETKKIVEHVDAYDESGEALMYSPVELDNMDYFIEDQHDYLHLILINGKNYPYDIRYADTNQAFLYIEKYEGTAVHPENATGKVNDYSQYDIVMQVFVRDTVIAVNKELKFPVDSNGQELLTTEQKLKIMSDLQSATIPESNRGYQVGFKVEAVDEPADSSYSYTAENTLIISKADPAGNHKGFISLGDNPELGHSYVVSEESITTLPGLELDKVQFSTYRYKFGQTIDLGDVTYTEVVFDGTGDIKSKKFLLDGDYKIAEVNVTNQYKEKQTLIKYVAVGNGKVAITPEEGEQPNFVDAPTETLAFYSGKAIGAMIYPGDNATFVGWFKDPDCTIPVNSKTADDPIVYVGVDGVWDKVAGSPTFDSFKPNANILNVDEVTFYAKFETGSFTIERTDAEPYQTFVYLVEREANVADGITAMSMYVTITCDENGYGKCVVSEVTKGNYTVTEIDDWTWRYPEKTENELEKGLSHDGTVAGSVGKIVTFSDEYTEKYWLNGYSTVAKNIFKGTTAQQGEDDDE